MARSEFVAAELIEYYSLIVDILDFATLSREALKEIMSQSPDYKVNIVCGYNPHLSIYPSVLIQILTVSPSFKCISPSRYRVIGI